MRRIQRRILLGVGAVLLLGGWGLTGCAEERFVQCWVTNCTIHPTVWGAREAAAYLLVSEDILHRLVKRGDLPHTGAGVTLRFRPMDLNAYLKKNTSQRETMGGGNGK